MNLTFFGAAGQVTGSSYLVETRRARVLVDCGLFQGVRMADELNVIPDRMKVSQLDAVLLTHAHLDHTGRLPLLVQKGFRGVILATPASIELAGLVLRDSAKVQAGDIARINRRRQRAGQPPEKPLYDQSDVEKVLGLFRPVEYGVTTSLAEGVSVRLADAGHMLGSSSVEMVLEEPGCRRVIVFSGDIGPRGAAYLRDPQPMTQADMVVMESTYGDRDHKPLKRTLDEFADIVGQCARSRGKMLVPTFAIGRTQQIIYHLAGFFMEGRVEPFPIFVDSPMAIEASRIYARHPELFDEEALQLVGKHPWERAMATVQTCATPEESRRLNDISGPCLILAGAGMCNAGRILHHLRNNLWKEQTSVIIVGYQARGSLGRMLVEKAPEVRIFGETIAVKAGVHTLGGFSAHAGQTELLEWFAPLSVSQPRVILTHGEDGPREALATQVRARHGIEPLLPRLGESLEI